MVHCRNTPVHQCTSAQGISYVYIAVAPSIAGGPSWFSVVNFSYIDSLKISTALSGLALTLIWKIATSYEGTDQWVSTA
jgi:hypothetical protein